MEGWERGLCTPRGDQVYHFATAARQFPTVSKVAPDDSKPTAIAQKVEHTRNPPIKKYKLNRKTGECISGQKGIKSENFQSEHSMTMQELPL